MTDSAADTNDATVTADEVRQGETGGHVRYILLGSFIGAAATLVVVWAVSAMT